MGERPSGHPVADAACATDIADQAPKEVQVGTIEVDGDAGTAVVDGYTFTVVRTAQGWKSDGGQRPRAAADQRAPPAQRARASDRT